MDTVSFSDVTRDDEKAYARWVRLHAAINRTADEGFYRLGYWVATRPKLTLLLNLAFVALCSIGFVNFNVLTDGERMVNDGFFYVRMFRVMLLLIQRQTPGALSEHRCTCSDLHAAVYVACFEYVFVVFLDKSPSV